MGFGRLHRGFFTAEPAARPERSEKCDGVESRGELPKGPFQPQEPCRQSTECEKSDSDGRSHEKEISHLLFRGESSFLDLCLTFELGEPQFKGVATRRFFLKLVLCSGRAVLGPGKS